MPTNRVIGWRRLRWGLGVGLGVALGLAAGTVGVGYGVLRASMPQLEGNRPLIGLSSPVRVERDALGVPRIDGANRLDVARASGFLHAQERFFQMDLQRRVAAGELSELLGARLYKIDAQSRRYQFRSLARRVLAQQSPQQLATLQAYVEGVNAGLAALSARSWEYQLLRTDPQPWKPEDSVLCIYTMWLDLQDNDGTIDRSLRALREATGEAGFQFIGGLAQRGNAALDGSVLPDAPLPTALPARAATAVAAATVNGLEPAFIAGSNSFAVSGARSASGVPILANDMHLSLRVPHIWYRASLQWKDAQGSQRRLAGVMLPGMPSIVVGSNGRVAWGFTNSNIDTVDVVELGPQDRISEHTETILVRGEASRQLVLRESSQGPLLTDADAPRQLALRWTALQPEATNLSLLGMEDAQTVAEAIDVAHHSGMPNQNLLAVDRDGHVGWTLTGAIPAHDATGWLPSDRTPTSLDPSDGLLWTANNRIVGGAALSLLGDGGYDSAHRALAIRDDLRARAAQGPMRELDLLAVQLSDAAAYLQPWRELLLTVLDDGFVAGQPARLALRDAVRDWGGHASIDSTGYRLLRAFRSQAVERALRPWLLATRSVYPEADLARLRPEHAALRLLQQQPAALLDPAYPSWQSLMQQSADAVIEQAGGTASAVADWNWGRYNTLAMRHPLSSALPALLDGWLNMPAEPLPGDSDMARVQRPQSGASQRLVVSPGREQEGILHMPGGQSGHPLSPYYRAGHEDWARGEPTALLPGETRWSLLLKP